MYVTVPPPPDCKRHFVDSCLYSNKDEKMIPGPLETDGLCQLIEMSLSVFLFLIFFNFPSKAVWAQWEVTCFFLDPVNALIYTSLNSRVCFSLPCPLLSVSLSLSLFPPTLSFFLSFFPGFWVPGRLDLPGQYRGFPASHSHHPLLQHRAVWEADPDTCLLVSFPLLSCKRRLNEHRSRGNSHCGLKWMKFKVISAVD